MLKWRAEIKDDRKSGYYEISVVLVDTDKRDPHYVISYGWEDFNDKITLPKTYSKIDEALWNKMIWTAHAFADLLNKRDGYGQATNRSDSEDLVSSV